MVRGSYITSKWVILLSGCIYLLTVCASCTLNPKGESKPPIVIIDTSTANPNQISVKWKERETYEIYYIGKRQDTVYINPKPYGMPPPPPGFRYDTTEFNAINSRVKEFDRNLKEYVARIDSRSTMGSIYSDSTKIFVDTSQIISKDSYSAFPIVIENSYYDTLRVGYEYNKRIYGILEAKDSMGNWKPINERNYPHGPPVAEEIILPRNNIIITAVYNYKGEYKTELRFKLGNNYSNTYSASINYNQFNSPFDENGNFKKEYFDNK